MKYHILSIAFFACLMLILHSACGSDRCSGNGAGADGDVSSESYVERDEDPYFPPDRDEDTIPPDGDEHSDLDREDGDQADGDIPTDGDADSESALPFPTWTDPATGFVWQATPTGGAMTWHDALSHCTDYGGGWRLPNISELRSIIRNCAPIETGGACGVKDECQPCAVSPADVCLSFSCCELNSCDPDACPDDGGPTGCYWPEELGQGCSWFWSSSSYVDDDEGAWGLSFAFGHLDGNYKTAPSYARCVRDGP